MPIDLSIVGWDDSYLSRLPHLDLTTVRQDADALARVAVRRCAARLAEQPDLEREVVLPPQLIIRGSTRHLLVPEQRGAHGTLDRRCYR